MSLATGGGVGCDGGTGDFMSNTCLAFSPETRATSSASTPRHFATVWATIGRVQGSLRPGRHRFRRDLPTSSSSFSGALGIMYGASLSKRILSSGRTPSFRASRKAFPGTSFEKEKRFTCKWTTWATTLGVGHNCRGAWRKAFSDFR